MITHLYYGLRYTSAMLSAALIFSFYTYGPYASSVPRPEDLLGYTIGSRHTVYADQDRVVKKIAESAADRVRLIPYGKSTEGRDLRVLALSSPENLRNLETIRIQNAERAQGKENNAPAVIWINECIHGDETASFESGMMLIYTLAASNHPTILKMLKETVVIVNPSYNPDGHERYVVAYNSIPTGNPEPGTYDRAIPSAFFGRANHYRFDMNRDRIAMSQAETRREVALFLQWNPQVYVDQHGQVETYFFPPVQQSINTNVDRDRYIRWTNIFGKATGTAFDALGWTYFIRDQFDFYNACYLDSHTSLMGAIGMTHETDGGRVIATKRSDETTLTLLDGIEKHFTSALAVIGASAEHRQELTKSYSDFKKKAVSGEHAGKFRRVVLTAKDPRVLSRLQEHLSRSGIESNFARNDWQQIAHDYWSNKVGRQAFPAGSLVVDMAQSQGPLAKALLEPQSDFEPDFIARQKKLVKARSERRADDELSDFEFYDMTAWALPYAYNLSAWWCEGTPKLNWGEPRRTEFTMPDSPVGFYSEYHDQNDILAVAKSLAAGAKVSLTTREMKLGGKVIPAGSFLFLAARNRGGLPGVEEAFRSLGGTLHPLTTSYPDEGRQGPGSESIVQIRKPKIGVVFGSAGSLDGGELWYLLENEWMLSYAGLTTTALNSIDSFTCLVFPEDVAADTSGRLADWVRRGGCLVSLGGGWATEFAKQEATKGETSLPGSIFKAKLDRLSWLGYGYENQEIAVPVAGDQFWKLQPQGAPISLVDETKLLSGWSWDKTEAELKNTAWLVESSVGRGRVVLFSQDPTFRAQWPGLSKLLLNAMILGPSI